MTASALMAPALIRPNGIHRGGLSEPLLQKEDLKEEETIEQVSEKSQESLNLFQSCLKTSAKQDQTSTNLILRRRHLRNEMAGHLFHAANKGLVGSIQDNRSERRKKWDKWANSKPKYLNALVKTWEQKHTGFLKNALVAFGKLCSFLIYYPVKWGMQIVNSALQATATSEVTMSRTDSVRVFKYFAKNPAEAQKVGDAVAKDIQAQKKLIDDNLPTDHTSKAYIHNIQNALNKFSTFILSDKPKYENEIRNQTIEMYKDLLEHMFEDKNKNLARLFLKDIISVVNRLTNEFDIIPEEKSKLISTYLFASKEFVNLLFLKVIGKNENEMHAVNALKNMVNQVLFNASMLSSYKRSDHKGTVWMWRSIAPISALFSKSAGIAGASAAHAGMFKIAAIAAIKVVGSFLGVLIASAPFVLPEVLLMIGWAKLAQVKYDKAANAVVDEVQSQTTAMLKTLGFEIKDEKADVVDKEKLKEIDKKRRTTTSTNKIRARISAIRDCKPGLQNRLLLATDSKESPDIILGNSSETIIKEASSLQREVEMQFTNDQNLKNNFCWYQFIEDIDSGEFNSQLSEHCGILQTYLGKYLAFGKIARAQFRAHKISTEFFDKLIPENLHDEVKRNFIQKRINEVIALADELANFSDGMSIHTMEEMYKKIHEIAGQISKELLALQPEIDASFNKNLNLFLQYNIIYFASVMTNNPRTKGNKAFRYSGLAVMPLTNFGVLKAESVAIVEKLQDPNLSPFSPGNFIPELGAGMVVGGITLGAAAGVSLALKDKAIAMDKEGIHKVNSYTRKYVVGYLNAKRDEWANTLEFARSIQKILSIDRKEAAVPDEKHNSQIEKIIHHNASDYSADEFSAKLVNIKDSNPNQYLVFRSTPHSNGHYKVEYEFIDSLMDRKEGYLLYPIVEADLQDAQEEVDSLNSRIEGLPPIHAHHAGFEDELTQGLAAALDDKPE